MNDSVNLRAVNHNLLPVLRALLRERSVTRAAETLGLTQPAASTALARLRLVLKDPLLIKFGRTMVISPRGETLLPQVEDLCMRLEQLWTSPEFDPATSRRFFSLTSPDYAQVILAPHLLEALARKAPSVALRFLDVPVDDVTHHRIRDIDFIIAIRESLQHPAMTDFVVESLYADRIVPVVGPKHRLYNAVHLSERDYEHEKTLVFVGGSHFLERRYESLSNAVALPATPAVVSQHYNAIALIAAQSDCIAFVPYRLARFAAGIMALRVIDPDYSSFRIDVCLAWNRRQQADQAHRWMRGTIRDAAAELEAI